ncbi:MAG: hypothetical protein R6X13_05150, partial [bacterium]
DFGSGHARQDRPDTRAVNPRKHTDDPAVDEAQRLAAREAQDSGDIRDTSPIFKYLIIKDLVFGNGTLPAQLTADLGRTQKKLVRTE